MANTIADELRDDPEIAEKILTMAGKMGAAVMAVRIRQLETEADGLRSRIGKLEQSAKADRAAFEKAISDLTERTKAAIERLRDAKK